MTWLDVLGPILGGAVGSLIALLGGYLRERETSRRYEAQLSAERDRLRQLAEAPESARDEIERFPISRPPTVGPLAALVAISLGAGMTGGAVAPKAVATLRGGPTYKSCDPPCPPGQRCESGTCTELAETEPAEVAGRRAIGPGSFVLLPGWRDVAASPWDRDPRLDRQ